MTGPDRPRRTRQLRRNQEPRAAELTAAASHGLGEVAHLAGEYFEQRAVQLASSHTTEQMLPELIDFQPRLTNRCLRTCSSPLSN